MLQVTSGMGCLLNFTNGIPLHNRSYSGHLIQKLGSLLPLLTSVVKALRDSPGGRVENIWEWRPRSGVGFLWPCFEFCGRWSRMSQQVMLGSHFSPLSTLSWWESPFSCPELECQVREGLITTLLLSPSNMSHSPSWKHFFMFWTSVHCIVCFVERALGRDYRHEHSYQIVFLGYLSVHLWTSEGLIFYFCKMKEGDLQWSLRWLPAQQARIPVWETVLCHEVSD